MKPIKNTENTAFATYDIALAGYLLCVGYELTGMDKTNRAKVLFQLQGNGNIDAAVKAFWDSRTSVDAQTYFNQIKRLKNQIFST